MALALLRMGMATGMDPVIRTRRYTWRPCPQSWCQSSGIHNIGHIGHIGLMGIVIGTAKAYGRGGAFRSIR
jgi:hypothetical protein